MHIGEAHQRALWQSAFPMEKKVANCFPSDPTGIFTHVETEETFNLILATVLWSRSIKIPKKAEKTPFLVALFDD